MGDLSPEVVASLGNLLRLYHKKAGKWREREGNTYGKRRGLR